MSEYRQSPAEALSAVVHRLRARAPVETNENWAPSKLADAVQRVACDESLVRPLASGTGLSAPMVRWALRTTAESFTVDTLSRLRERAGLGGATWPETTNRMRLATVVLAGNVFTACLRPLVLSLLYEVPVLARTSSREASLAEAFVRSLPPPYDAACAITSFARDDDASWEAFFRHADATHVYGSDETLEAIRARTPIGTRFVGHGHGLGVAIVRADADAAVASALALDVAAYDQRGCLSPQEVLVVGTPRAGEAFAERLADALGAVEATLPRGPLPSEVAAASRRWQDVALATGELFARPTAAVAFDPSGMLPFGPGHRHVVVRVLREEDVSRHLATYGRHLKALGLGPSVPPAWIPPEVVPRVSPIGTMQTPPMDAPLDGLPPSEGYLAFVGLR
ncbi:MAG: hypothetical protein H6724_12205 [Sandaracinus sp.]|nr:hypothetical protein [Sandaracinus sp.]MCB9620198.1 hypothetical protein [Sandaracinus sp.]